MTDNRTTPATRGAANDDVTDEDYVKWLRGVLAPYTLLGDQDSSSPPLRIGNLRALLRIVEDRVTPTLRAPEVTGAENYVTPAEVTQGCRTYCDIFEPSGPFQNEHNRRVRRAKGNRGDAIRAVLQEFLKGRTTPKSTPTGLPHDSKASER